MKLQAAVSRILAGTIIFLGSQVYALTPAQVLVEKMSHSAKTLSYKGYFNYQRGQQDTGYKIVHWVQGDIEKQRLVFLDGAPFEIINDGHSLKCLHAGDVNSDIDAAHSVDANPVHVLSGSLDSIWENYDAAIAGSSRVAGREVTRVQLSPKDNHRYPYVFFVDNETGLMLKMAVLSLQGQLLERFHFVMIDYKGVTEADLKPQIKDFKMVNHAVIASESGGNPEQAWHLVWVPSGFKEEKAKMHDWSNRANNTQVYMFSDGLSAFSVFVEPVDADVGSDTSAQMGSTSAISHYAAFAGKMFLVTVVGEIPMMTAKQIALSIRPPA
jgi:sigma-E factor negative regulatory protein RseB